MEVCFAVCLFIYVFFVGFYGLASIAIAYKNAEEYLILLYFLHKLSSLKFSRLWHYSSRELHIKWHLDKLSAEIYFTSVTFKSHYKLHEYTQAWDILEASAINYKDWITKAGVMREKK